MSNKDYNEYEPDLITLIDEEGTEYNFEILDVIDEDDRTFFALSPIFDDSEDQVSSEGEYLIMEQVLENDEPILAEIDDEALLDRLSEIFEKHFDELFDDNEQNADI